MLRMRGVQKAFGPVVALGGVDLDVGAGEVHTLIGENGAGKSTLMKVLSGAHAPDAGTMELGGAPYAPAGPQDALARGVAMIYQELNLAPHLSVAENVMLGREPRRFGLVDRPLVREQVRATLAYLDHPEIDPGTRVGDLGPGAKQVVEIARALAGDARVLVMDEPTSSLSRNDTERMFDVVRKLRDDGVAVIYISHFLEEVTRIGDTFTVLRDGRTVGSGRLGDVAVPELIRLMTGRDIEDVFPVASRVAGEDVLVVEDLRGDPLPERASLRVARGEILGIAGLVGAGRTELLRSVFGLEPVHSGRVRLTGRAGMLSEDRKEEGLALSLSVAENTTLSRLAPYTRLGWISRSRQARATERWIDRLAIRCSGPDQAAGALSGGNQQKVALARLLHEDCDVLLLDEPTRGVDVGSKVEIYRLIGELAAQGKGVLMVSSYLPELLGVCDRIAVMHRGVLGSARPAGAWTEAELLDEATRGVA